MNSVFLGKIVTKGYYLDECKNLISGGYYHKPFISERQVTVKRMEISKTDVNLPMFQPKEEIYIDDLKVYTTIEKAARSTNGDMVYNVSYVAKEVTIEEAKIINENNCKNMYSQLDAEKWLNKRLIEYDEWINCPKTFDEFMKYLVSDEPTIIDWSNIFGKWQVVKLRELIKELRQDIKEI